MAQFTKKKNFFSCNFNTVLLMAESQIAACSKRIDLSRRIFLAFPAQVVPFHY